MSKAILVMGMPEKCAVCAFRCSIEFDKPFCFLTMNNVTPEEYYKSKPEWCPLKPMPEKFGCYLSVSDVFKDGWNACIDAICGKE